ncbi:MAG TPA: nitrilase-related carbon-nitrogen hydrolase [Patescibacteria group bacterium]|nr:nitrilase-related carbon-nitrogen hydrolase [Patescibacteria group bacterium]
MKASLLWLLGVLILSKGVVSAAEPAPTNTVRVAAAQAAKRVIDFHLKPAEALAAVEKNLSELEKIVARAGEAKCDALVLPEDTPGVLNWLGANEPLAKEVLPKAVKSMIERLGSAAARHKMCLVVCSDFIEADGFLYNTAFLLGRDGREIGRYHKVCPTWSEAGVRQRGNSFPVFSTPDIGTAGMLICYDLVVPETARCIALAGADIIFFPTMGTAAIGDDDIGVQALRVRAAENFIWLAVAHRGSGAMIISPQGKIVAKAEGPDGLAIADIDVRGQREGGDAMNWQRDMRARLFRERKPEAFQILTDTRPPVLDKVPIDLTSQEAGRVMARTLTVGEDEFKQANALIGRGQTDEAIAAFERLRKDYPATWIDRRSEERLANLNARADDKPARSKSPGAVENASLSTNRIDSSPRPLLDRGGEGSGVSGLASKYPGDAGIAKDPDVLFADNFESGDMKQWDQQKRAVMTEDKPNSGRWCVQMPMQRGKNTGADAIKWFMPGADAVYARVYVKFSPDYQYNHHFVWLGANQRTNKWSAFGKAGLKPNGTYYSTGMEPWFAWGKNPPPGEVNLYTYYLDMEPDRKMNKYWGNGFFPPGPGKGKDASASRVIPPLNQWQCWEFMIQANTAPDKADGKQAMWVDGKLIGEFTGIRWRNDMDLKVNCFWLEHYGYDEGDPTKQYWKESQSVWFDDLVVARRYIGPIKR